MEILLKVIPDAYIIVRLNSNPPMDWLEEHTEELRTYNDGSYIRPYGSCYPRNKYEAAQSTASELWRRDASKAILEFYEELEKYPCGVFLNASDLTITVLKRFNYRFRLFGMQPL